MHIIFRNKSSFFFEYKYQKSRSKIRFLVTRKHSRSRRKEYIIMYTCLAGVYLRKNLKLTWVGIKRIKNSLQANIWIKLYQIMFYDCTQHALLMWNWERQENWRKYPARVSRKSSKLTLNVQLQSRTLLRILKEILLNFNIKCKTYIL